MPPLVRRIALVALTLALLAGLQYGAQAALNPYFVRILAVCAVNIMLAVSLNLVNGTTGQFSIGHAGFMAVGAYAGALTSHALDPRLAPHGALGEAAGLVLAGVAAVLASGVAGVLVGVPSLRLRGDYLAIVTLGFGEIIRISIESIPFLGGSQGYPLGAESIPAYAGLGWLWGGSVLAAVVVWNLTYSSHGRALAAIREDEIAAEAVGIDTTKYKVLAFAISAMVTGLAGCLYAHDATGGQHLEPGAFRLDRSVDMLVMIIFGGLGSITGAILGGLFVTISLELLRGAREYRLVVYPMLLILMMLLRPKGLLGTREFSLGLLRSVLPRRRGAAS
ncbi:MAG: branched-chain amino acid ABC transporter permease [Deltaproteobacteria bacterium]|nr:branched-chain amino acid ABC transporter permease [Deltaproteobacteria bacterium]